MAGLDFGALIGSVLDAIAKYWWIAAFVAFFAIMFMVVYWLTRMKKKKTQWTHTLKITRVLSDGKITPEVIHKMRRFPLEKGVEMFELENPILGSYLIPQPGEYTGINEFSIILDANNRIWVNKGIRFNKDKQSLEVSAVHAGIDVEMAAMKEKWQQAHKVEKRITTAELIKAGLKILGIIAIVIVAIVGLNQWGSAQQYKAQQAQAEAQAMSQINQATQNMQTIVNTQQLQIIPMLEALYGSSSNVASAINKYRPQNLTNVSS